MAFVVAVHTHLLDVTVTVTVTVRYVTVYHCLGMSGGCHLSSIPRARGVTGRGGFPYGWGVMMGVMNDIINSSFG